VGSGGTYVSGSVPEKSRNWRGEEEKRSSRRRGWRKEGETRCDEVKEEERTNKGQLSLTSVRCREE